MGIGGNVMTYHRERAWHDCDAPHGAAAFWADGEVLSGEFAITSGAIARRSRMFIEQLATEGDVIAAPAIGEEAAESGG